MEVLRTSVQVRSFGLIRETSSASTARVRLLVETIREDMVKNIFFFVGASAEPIVDFDSLGDEEAPKRRRKCR